MHASRIDSYARRLLTAICSGLLAIMVLFTCYTVLMRWVFNNPPFWGDTLTLFANIWLVLLALALATRERDHIAMQMLNDLLPARAAIAMEGMWNALLVGIGIVMAVYGWEAAMLIPGMFWELGNLPKTYPMLILPISGVLVAAAGVLVLAEDWQRFKSGKRVGPNDSDGEL